MSTHRLLPAAVLALLTACGPSHPAQGTPAAGQVELRICDQTLTIEVANRAFLAEAQRLLEQDARRVPVFDLVDGAGVDPQWTWHVDPATPAWADLTVELCDGCPGFVEADKAYWIGTVRQYCPWSARVVAVRAAE
ncbi:MAG: hypothetical protein QM767_23395 [Anaeromyxobacter sp.]